MSLESSIISFVAQKLGDLLVDEVKLLKGVEDQVQSMQRELTWIGSYLRDVDEGQEESSHILRTRIKEIRNITFKAEDVIDSFIFLEDRRTRKSFLKRYVFSFPNYLVQRHQIASEIKAINTMIQENKKRFETYHVSRRNEQIQRRLPQGNPLNNDDFVVGLKDDISMLVRELTTEHEKNVLCIAGMGGSGKTTLAKKLYNHETIKQHFQCKVWVCISQEWSVDHILVQILRQATGQENTSGGKRSTEGLVEEVHKHLGENLYLIVLDDIWKKEALKDLLPAFPIRRKGSKIIITTRFSEIVKIPGLFYSFHEPRRLNDVESWDLLTKIALNQRQRDDFKRLGEEMLKKCAGLPLAIIALGGILYGKHSIEEWEMVSKDVSAKVMEGSGTQDYGIVKDVLALSYHVLPYDLKPCFLYFALFPEDFVISVGPLMRMWISEGFITEEQRCGEETLEDVARQFLDELIQRCVVQVASRNYEGKVKNVRIHDLIRELCTKKAKERDFLQIFHSQSSTAQTQVEGGIIAQSRRISIYSSSSNICIRDQAQNSHLRSLFFFQLGSDGGCFYFNSASVHKNFPLLKVLDISIPYYITGEFVFPVGIGNLIHLTYVRILYPSYIKLPESIANLRNLLTLDCSGCAVVVPNGFFKLFRLQHIFSDAVVVPNKCSFSTLKDLQTLKSVRGGEWMLKGMSTLSPTVKRLKIHNMSTNEQLEAVFQCPSFKLGRLHSLSLNWDFDAKLLNMGSLFLYRGLHELNLYGKIEEEESSPPNLLPSDLEKLSLYRSRLKSNKTMSALGKLPNLRHLYLSSLSYIGKEWTCSTGEFPQLEHLEIKGLFNLEEWRIEKGAMPRLSSLRVFRCERLTRLPKLGNNVVVVRE